MAIAGAQIAVAKVFPDPELTVGVIQYDVTHQGNPTIAGVQLSVPVELGGKRGARVAVARSGVDAAHCDLDEAIRALRASAANAFADSLHARLVLAQKEGVLANLQRLVAINERRVAAGDVADVALLQSRVEARQFQADVIAAVGERRAVDVALLQLLGSSATGMPGGSERGQAVAGFAAAAERVQRYDSGMLADADVVLDRTLYNYQRGGATLVDYLIAQRTASDVHLAYYDALADRAHALAAVEQATGSSDLVRFSR